MVAASFKFYESVGIFEGEPVCLHFISRTYWRFCPPHGAHPLRASLTLNSSFLPKGQAADPATTETIGETSPQGDALAAMASAESREVEAMIRFAILDRSFLRADCVMLCSISLHRFRSRLEGLGSEQDIGMFTS